MTVERRSFLVVGGGIAGMSAAIALARTGAKVRLVEVDPDWRVYGAGITITGATYCAFAELGLLDELCARGFGALGGTRLCLADGEPFADLEAASLRPGIPPIGGIMRPVLHEMLARTTREAGVEVCLGTTVEDWQDAANGVTATLSDGTRGDYAAIVIADGASSPNRARLFPEGPAPTYTGQYCWRLVAERPAGIDRGHIYSAPPIFAGLIPTSPTAMYLWLLEPRAEKTRIAPDSRTHRAPQDHGTVRRASRQASRRPGRQLGDRRPSAGGGTGPAAVASRAGDPDRRRGPRNDAPSRFRGGHRDRGCGAPRTAARRDDGR